MILRKTLASAMLMASMMFSSCSKKETATPAPSTSKRVTYSVAGNYSGTLFVSYTTAPGGTANDAITLPWTKEIVYDRPVSAAIIAISGNGGTAGQTATVVVKLDGNQKSTTTATAAGSTGSFSVSAPVLTF